MIICMPEKRIGIPAFPVQFFFQTSISAEIFANFN